MDFKQIEYFLAIYEEGSISKAADKMFISQQGLSKAILALEKELDCRLFLRNPKGVLLTEAGEALLLHAYQLMDAKSHITKEMSKFREHETLVLDLAIGSRFSLPKGIFKKFRAEYPNVDISINERKNETCIYNLERGKTDLAVVIQPEKKNGYIYEAVKKEILTIVMPDDHILAQKEELSLKELEGERIAYHEGSSSVVFMEQCKKQGVTFAKAIKMPGMPALYQTCADMKILGLSLSSIEGMFQFPKLISVPIRPEEATWDITLMYHESAVKRKVVKAFLEIWKKFDLEKIEESR